jgi:hypothetical protein
MRGKANVPRKLGYQRLVYILSWRVNLFHNIFTFHHDIAIFRFGGGNDPVP